MCPAGCDNSTVVAGECDTCASGCFCPSGLVQFDSQLCVLSEQCSVYDGMYMAMHRSPNIIIHVYTWIIAYVDCIHVVYKYIFVFYMLKFASPLKT